jgi:hypothetical protein
MIAMVVAIFAGLGGTIINMTRAADASGMIVGLGGRCIDVDNAVFENRRQIWMWDCHGGAAQIWTVRDNGTITIGGNYCLDVYWGKTEAQTPIWLFTCNGSAAQQWRYQANGTLLNPNSGRCLDVQWGRAENFVPLWLWDCYGGEAQRWNIPLAPPPPPPTPTPTDPTPTDPTPTPTNPTPTPTNPTPTPTNPTPTPTNPKPPTTSPTNPTPPTSGGTTSPTPSRTSTPTPSRTSGTSSTTSSTPAPPVITNNFTEKELVKPGKKIQRVIYYLDGVKVAEVTEAPFLYRPDTTTLSTGTHLLRAETIYTDGTIINTTRDINIEAVEESTNAPKRQAAESAKSGSGTAIILFMVGGCLLIVFLIVFLKYFWRPSDEPSVPKEHKSFSLFKSRSSSGGDDAGFVELGADTITDVKPARRINFGVPRKPSDWWR